MDSNFDDQGNRKLIEDALREKFSGTGNEYRDLAERIPQFYRYLTFLLDDPQLPKEFRPFLVGTVGLLSLPSRILPDPDKNLLGIGFLVASVIRQLAERPDGEQIVTRNWPGENSHPQDVLSEVIRQGNEALDRHEIKKIFRFAGFETRE